MKNKRTVAIFALIVAIIAVATVAIVFAQDVPFEDALRNQIIQAQERAAETAAELQRTDQITTVLCGTASPAANTGAQSCTAVFVNGQFLLFDIGNNAMQSMMDSNIPLQEVDAVFITHYHNDHYAELGEVMEWSWINGRRHILPIHGPTGLTQIVDGFWSAYELERSYRTAHHGAEVMPPEWSGVEAFEFVAPEGDAPMVVYENDGVTVEAFRATHEPIHPAVGYRITYADTLIVISGDTVLTSAVIANSQDADLLVAEVMNMSAIEVMEDTLREIGQEDAAQIFFDIRDYHMDVSDVARLAEDANVERLALTHLAPYVQSRLQLNALFVDPIREVYEGEIFAGEDGLTIVIPVSQQ
ncbi:MAG: MBL fold metallo-hydrolase [Anaerolineae bacterium]